MQVGGIAEVRKAFRTVKDTVVDLEKTASREAVAAAKRREKAAEKESQLRIKLAHKEKQERVRLEASVDKEFGKLLLHQTKVAEKAANDRAKSEEQANRRIQRDADATAKYLERVRLNSAKAAGRIAAKEAADAHRATAKAAREAEVAAKKRERAIQSGLSTYGGAAMRGIGNVAGMGIRLAGAGMALGGGFAVADAAKTFMGAEAASIDFANSLRVSSEGKSYSNRALMGMASNIQGESGVAKEELLAGWQNYVAMSGDTSPFDGDDKSKKNLLEMAKLSKATGANFGDIMSAAGSLSTQNSDLDSGDIVGMLRAMVGQGGAGAVEISDLANLAGVATSTSVAYQGDQKANQLKLLGLTQIARKTSGSAADAVTAVQRFAGDVGKHATENKARGIKVTDKDGKLVSPGEIMEQYFKATKGNTIKMGEGRGNLGLGAESLKIANSLSSDYKKAFEAARKGGKSEKESVSIAAAAVRKKVEETADADASQAMTDQMFKDKISGSQEKFSAAMMRLSEIVEQRGAPMLERLADSVEKIEPEKIKKFVDAIASAVEWLVENPWKGLGLAVTGSIVKEIVAAKAGDVIRDALVSLINKMGGAGAGGGATGGAGAGAGAGGTNVGRLALAASVGLGVGASAEQFGEYISGVDDSINRVEKSKLALNTANQLQDKRLSILSGGSSALTAEEIATYRRQYKAAMEIGQDAQNQANEGVGVLGRITDAVGLTGHMDQIRTQGSAAQSVIDQIRDLDRLTGGQISNVGKKIEPAELVDAAGVKKTVGDALQQAADRVTFGNKPADPNAPNRNVPLGQRPPA